MGFAGSWSPGGYRRRGVLHRLVDAVVAVSRGSGQEGAAERKRLGAASPSGIPRRWDGVARKASRRSGSSRLAPWLVIGRPPPWFLFEMRMGVGIGFGSRGGLGVFDYW